MPGDSRSHPTLVIQLQQNTGYTKRELSIWVLQISIQGYGITASQIYRTPPRYLMGHGIVIGLYLLVIRLPDSTRCQQHAAELLLPERQISDPCYDTYRHLKLRLRQGMPSLQSRRIALRQMLCVQLRSLIMSEPTTLLLVISPLTSWPDYSIQTWRIQMCKARWQRALYQQRQLAETVIWLGSCCIRRVKRG